MNIDILNGEQSRLLLSILSESRHVAVVCHKSPDGDALGSSLAWAGFLRSKYGVDATVIVPDAYPDFLQWLPESQTIVRYDKKTDEAKQLLADADHIFCLDFNKPERVNEMEASLVSSGAKKVMIDHHLDPDMDTVLTVSHPEMSSTCELVFRIVWQLGGFDDMDSKWATQVYCGMMTDTGGFTYNSSRPEIFHIIGSLLTKGIGKDKIYRNVYNNYSSWAVRLRGYVMAQKLNVMDDLHASYFAISKMDMEEYRFIKGDAEGLVNVPLTIKGLKLSISLREDTTKDNLVWVSIRSVDDFPANAVAEQFFNGGGHLNAAGGHLDCSLDEACGIARTAIKAFSERLKK
jgi:bifunctional oligoribonuclease and PAP phosphatase NrnA